MFLDHQDREQFKWHCAKQRKFAREHPARSEEDLFDLRYNMRLGPWSMRLVLEGFHREPVYRASISYLQDTGEKGIFSEEGKYLFDVPRQTLLAVKDWPAESYSTAKELLGDLMGSLINGKTQPVTEQRGVMALHWLTSVKEAHKGN